MSSGDEFGPRPPFGVVCNRFSELVLIGEASESVLLFDRPEGFPLCPFFHR
jgi:hypothetical protein